MRHVDWQTREQAKASGDAFSLSTRRLAAEWVAAQPNAAPSPLPLPLLLWFTPFAPLPIPFVPTISPTVLSLVLHPAAPPTERMGGGNYAARIFPYNRISPHFSAFPAFPAPPPPVRMGLG